MELRRKAYESLKKWKANPKRKPLIVEGLRQVGKSFLVAKFAKENYANVVVFDFRHDIKTRAFFSEGITVDKVLENAYPYFPENLFVPSDTVIIFEEIGDCPWARASLKAFAMDGRFDIIATGSLLGVANCRKRKAVPMPTGYEEYLKMTSLDFEEFLWAYGTSKKFIEALKQRSLSFEGIPQTYADYGKAALKAYLLVGGMPDAVTAFLESGGNLMAARNVQERLLRDYEGDFGRFVDENGEEKIDYVLKGRISAVWQSLPSQLARENGNAKFRYRDVGGRGRSDDFALAVDWLIEAGLVIKGKNTYAPEPPLLANAIPNEFKLFAADPGLLAWYYGPSLLPLAFNELLGARKGALIENYLAICMDKGGRDVLYYADSIAHKEIDFLTEYGDGIALIEGKATNGKMLSSKALVEGATPYKNYRCYKIIESNFGEGSFYQTLPHYAFPFLLSSFRHSEDCFVPLDKSPI